MSNLTEPIAPDITDPQPFGPLAGDWQDDDGEAIDEGLEPNPGGPVDYGVLLTPGDATIPECNRLVTNTVTMLATDNPVQLLPADPNRKSLTLYFSVSATSSPNGALRFASEYSLAYSGARIMPVWVSTGIATARTDGGITLDGYTGPLYVWPDPASGATDGVYIVSVWAVTK